MKKVALRPVVKYSTFSEAEVVDYPEGRDLPRVRCRIRIDFRDAEIREMQEKGMDRNAILDRYRAHVEDLVQGLIGEDTVITGGMEEFLEPVSEKIG